MSLYLTISTGRDAGQRVALTERETVLVGRGDACSVRLTDPSASRVHCRVTLTGGRVFVEDAGSRWGTLVNGQPIESKELQPGDAIVIGDTELRLEIDRPEASTIAPERRRAVEGSPHPLIPSSPHHAESAKDAMRGTGNEEMRRVLPALKLNDLVGEKFLRFRVGSVVARSRSGIVFRALDPKNERTVALKVFWPDFFADEKSMRRFLRAVRTMLPLEHENLVMLHTAGRWRGLCFTASEYIEGESATHLIQRVGIAGMLDWRKAWKIAVGLARALEYAHERSIVHRNLRPSNILIRESDNCVKLGDLMLAKALDDMGGERITSAGEVVGDVFFLSPEQLSGEAHIDARADIYSLGATMYAILTGRPPFEGSTAEVIGRVISAPPVPPTKYHLAIPAAFEGVVLRMLAKRPDDRFESASQLLQDLERVGKFQGVT
jgi:pSer/pThr/pTyr-binding forkhead associated (FHA) protein